MSTTRHYDQDKDSTLYVGNLDERCTDALVWELMLQAGPIVNVHLPKDRVTQTHQGYGFVEFATEDDADYAAKIMNQIRLYGKPIRVNKASADKRGAGGSGEGTSVGAELYVGGLDSMVDEKVLYETFSRFGPLVAAPKVSRDDANLSKNYGFISYASFDSSDEAIANMNGQYLMNREITVQYAYKKDGKGERHGDAAERALAAQAKKHGVQVQIPAMPAALVMPNSTPSAPAAMNGTPYAANGTPQSGRTPQPPPSYNYGAFAPPPGPAPPVRSYNAGPPSANYNAVPPPASYNSVLPPASYHAAPPPANYNAVPPPRNYDANYDDMPRPPPGLPQATLPPNSLPPNPNRGYNQSPLQAPPTGAGLPARPPRSMAGYGGPMNAPGMQPGYQPPQPPPGMPPGMPPPPAGFRPPGATNGLPPPPQNPGQQQY